MNDFQGVPFQFRQDFAGRPRLSMVRQPQEFVGFGCEVVSLHRHCEEYGSIGQRSNPAGLPRRAGRASR
jgi:hypothetical protein